MLGLVGRLLLLLDVCVKEPDRGVYHVVIVVVTIVMAQPEPGEVNRGAALGRSALELKREPGAP